MTANLGSHETAAGSGSDGSGSGAAAPHATVSGGAVSRVGAGPRGRAILGGSFNPPHVGHLRLAIEAAEALTPLVTGVDLVPCAVPPHKTMTGMLPFDLRARMVEASITDLPFLRCNRLEGQRQGPSYTWDTLLAYREVEPQTELYFILGSPDFALLPTWHRGLELPGLCNFVVVPRDGQAARDVIATAQRLWPEARERAPLVGDGPCMGLPGGGLAHFLPLPWLDVSASRLRSLWLAGRRVDFLLPRAAFEILKQSEKTVQAHWRQTEPTC
ncbi:MAG: nicotinate-nicotinamide nucleotide adenylyltransferase [Desulfovibrio sp.]|uniref:nicotinate-nicotinamide nucleotide adenylyltransferase n=1 Tax=Desulfovibrio sp. TaxID=885 RepID=UPI002A365E09|nr:nicotinate-nicotinamide nucleotide adenylyltransferase [Desulfovibrio sp.]MDY0260039.1 nicotinate-nicotinamide nucleotide adenylyltransferase [Desulfovibrio sp.]